MKKIINKLNQMCAALAFAPVVLTANSAYGFVVNQPKLPESAKKHRKF